MKEQLLTSIITLQSMKSLLLGIIISISTVFLPLKPIILTVLLFVSFDTAFSIYGTVVKKGWGDFTSHKFFNVFVKTVFFVLGLLGLFLIDTYFIGGSIWGVKLAFTKVFGGACIFNEIKSIDETLVNKLGKKSLWVQFTEMINKAKKLKKDLSGLFKTEEK